MFFGSTIPQEESTPAAHELCSDEEGAQQHCPKRWAAMQEWFTLARQVSCNYNNDNNWDIKS